MLGPDGRVATGDPAHVPVGIYAEQALKKLGIWDAVSPRLARTDDVRSALLLVERGEAPAGIVYATDAAVSKAVMVAGTFPANSHDPVSYPFAVVEAGDTPEARALMTYLAGPAGARHLRQARLQGRIACSFPPEEWQAVRLTLGVAARAVGFGLPLAVVTAWVLARVRFPGRPVLNALVHLPLVLPPVVTGWLLLIIFGFRGPIGSLLQRLVRCAAGLHHRRRQPGLRGDDIPGDGARRPLVAGVRRPRAGSGGTLARRRHGSTGCST